MKYININNNYNSLINVNALDTVISIWKEKIYLSFISSIVIYK